MKEFIYILGASIAGNDVNIAETPVGNDTVTGTVLPLVFGILGALSLLFVVIGGLRYTISSGDPQNTQKARETIIYALVGLFISISAFTITNYVLNNVRVDEVGEGGLVGPNGILTIATQQIVYITGVVSVIMVIYGGIKYIVSGGDSNGTKTARDTILYALIGLVIAISAQGIVTFVLERI